MKKDGKISALLHILFDAFDGVFLKARDLCLRDTDLAGDLHLRFTVGIAQSEDEAFPRAQAAHGLLECDLLEPVLVSVFAVAHLVHDAYGIATVGIDGLEEGDRIAYGVHGEDDLLARDVKLARDLLDRGLALLLALQLFTRLSDAVGRVAHRAADANGAVVAQIPPDLADDHRHAVGGKTNILRSVEVVDGL